METATRLDKICKYKRMFSCYRLITSHHPAPDARHPYRHDAHLLLPPRPLRPRGTDPRPDPPRDPGRVGAGEAEPEGETGDGPRVAEVHDTAGGCVLL